MFIAFEGPDNTGKSTSAAKLATSGQALYNATKSMHRDQVTAALPEEIVAYDRIDWFTHMVYRLALPERDWNDERPRTVFAMPETHLVVKLHHPDRAAAISDELYTTGTLARVNPVYFYFADYFMHLNKNQDYSLFKSINIIEVDHDQKTGTFSQRLVDHDSKGLPWGSMGQSLVTDEDSLLEFLKYVETEAA